MRILNILAIALVAALLSSCASMSYSRSIKQTGSIVDYLYPDAKEPPAMTPTVTRLRPPVKVGIAFVPGAGWGNGTSEATRMKLLERVRDSFSRPPYIGKIEIIPTQYMRARGGFTNLEQVGRMFDVEVVALLSYDQVQFNDSNALSMLYWTIIGAYVVHGDQYDVQTMLDASVFDVRSHKLLFRAPGTSQVKGSASWAGFSEKSRAAQAEGYNAAVDQLVPNLQAELDNFRERIKHDANYQVENKEGYKGGGAMDWLGLALVALLAGLAWRLGRRA
ncbi:MULTISPECIES: rhombotarget lipoprotein [unclassified Duganella]|uniref:rhombotarget lipoprotein n=1 Tax=unclassified Duganella TaxID=2636909 RepID=UPI000E3563B2|nr:MULTISPECIES: rhombotarget lipoprotein [unclassified Duganella]RFP18831.1 rhombotarget lipoprotein [Duganella sp. BJB475]RFP35496.1 rhombotarget lipoprotein [Duganella sp. BJB476]